MTAFDPQLAARIAESGIPLSADLVQGLTLSAADDSAVHVLSDERLAEIKSLLRYETSISFHSARAKESMLLLVVAVERLRAYVVRIENALCECAPEREHSDYSRPADYLHAAGCLVVDLQQASEQR